MARTLAENLFVVLLVLTLLLMSWDLRQIRRGSVAGMLPPREAVHTASVGVRIFFRASGLRAIRLLQRSTDDLDRHAR